MEGIYWSTIDVSKGVYLKTCKASWDKSKQPGLTIIMKITLFGGGKYDMKNIAKNHMSDFTGQWTMDMDFAPPLQF